MQWLNTLNTIVVTIGVPSVVAALVYIGRKLQTLDSLKKEVDENIRPDLKDVRERFASLEGKAQGYFAAHSPISLTPSGVKFLEGSGLKEFIDANKETLAKTCADIYSMETPYDVQEAVFNLFDGLELPADVENKVKSYAYQHGSSVDVAKRIGAIYLRDLCLEDRGFAVDGLDTDA